MVYTRQMCTTSASDSSTSPNSANDEALLPLQRAIAISGGPAARPPPPSSQPPPSPAQQSQQLNLLDLPVEVIHMIFGYLSYKNIERLRLVSRKINDICSQMLSSTFSKLINHTFQRFNAIKAEMPRRESARRMHPLSGECDIIETCYMRLSLLQMSIGKHIERGHCCFFPGAVLDEVYSILNYVRNSEITERSYRITDELFDLSTMAMEYFRDCIEPTLPQLGYFNKDFLELPSAGTLSADNILEEMTRPPRTSRSSSSATNASSSSSCSSPPQSNMVLRKGIRKIKQGMKMYNNQLSVLRNELRSSKRKAAEQSKQLAEQQKLLAEQQKQTLECASRFEENDKKHEEMTRKFSTLLQELIKCRTELQYWRSKAPTVGQVCISCGEKMTNPTPPTLTPEEYEALMEQQQGSNGNGRELELHESENVENSGHTCHHQNIATSPSHTSSDQQEEDSEVQGIENAEESNQSQDITVPMDTVNYGSITQESNIKDLSNVCIKDIGAGNNTITFAVDASGSRGIDAVPTRTFYNHQHKSVIVSPSTAKAFAAVAADWPDTARGNEVDAASVTSLQLINTQETKKARRVQKSTRIQVSGKRNKSIRDERIL